MKKYLFFTFVILFLFIPNVFAAPGWGKDIRNFPTQFSIRDCSGQSCNTSKATTPYSFNLSDQGDTYTYYGSSGNISMSAGGSGAMVIYGVVSGLNPSTLYSSTLYVCTDYMNIGTNYINYDFYIGSEQNSVAQRNNHGYDRFLFTGTALDSAPFVRYISGGSPIVQTFDACYSRTILFNPTGNYRFIGMSMKATANTSGKIYILGYDLEPLGSVNNLTSEDISHAVQTSGLATAKSVTQVQSSINEVKQEISGMQDEQKKTNKKLDDLNDNVTSDDTSGANSESSSFFNNFNDNQHGLSGIISAPLNSINAMLSGTCTPLTATWEGKDISLPCGQSFWSKIPEIQEFLNLILGGLLCYHIILKLYRLIDKLKNPDDDRVEVMDL